MRSLKWTTSNAVFVTEIDDEHKEIFEALSNAHEVFAGGGPVLELPSLTERLISSITGHFAHEERLMRAARYESLLWHKTAHDNARKRVVQFVRRIEQGDIKAGLELVGYLTSWLHDHTGLADRMLGAFLRNHNRCTLTFKASTRPTDSCSWVTASGDAFSPEIGEDGSRQHQK